MAKKVPKYIIEKCKHLDALCDKATGLRYEIEAWCEKNGIDTTSFDWDYEAKNTAFGCYPLSVEGIERLLTKDKDRYEPWRY